MIHYSLLLFTALIFFGGAGNSFADDTDIEKADEAFKAGRFEEALGKYKKLSFFGGDLRARARLQSGSCYVKLRNIDKARSEWASLRQFFPESVEAPISLIRELEITEDAKIRAELERKLLAKYSDSPQAKKVIATKRPEKQVHETLESRVMGLLEAGKRDEAIRALLQESKKADDVERDRALIMLASIYESAGEWRKSLGVWEDLAASAQPQNRENAAFQRINALESLGGREELAEKLWVEFISEHPDGLRSALATLRLAEIKVKQGRLLDAEDILDRWLEGHTEDFNGYEIVASRKNEIATKRIRSMTVVKSEAPKIPVSSRLDKLVGETDTLMLALERGRSPERIIDEVAQVRDLLSRISEKNVIRFKLDLIEIRALVAIGSDLTARAMIDDAWESYQGSLRGDESLALAEPTIGEICVEGSGVALKAGRWADAVSWAERFCLCGRLEEKKIKKLKDLAVELARRGRKSEAGEVLVSFDKLSTGVDLTKFSNSARKDLESVSCLRNLCESGAPQRMGGWWVGEIPTDYLGIGGRELFEADLYFASLDREKAINEYRRVTKLNGLRDSRKGYATLQLARCLAADGKSTEALRVFREFERNLSNTKSAPAALLRAGTLCAGQLNNPRKAAGYFEMLVERYPESEDAELAAWYGATLKLWSGELREAKEQYDLFEKRFPDSSFITTLNVNIRPQLER